MVKATLNRNEHVVFYTTIQCQDANIGAVSPPFLLILSRACESICPVQRTFRKYAHFMYHL